MGRDNLPRWKAVKSWVHRKGYLRISLSKCNKKRLFYVQILVLEAFCGPRPCNMQACHNNGDPSDNRVENLRWDTPVGNAADKRVHGRQARGEDVHFAKLSIESVKYIIQAYKSGGITTYKLAELYGVSKSCICSVVNGESWKHAHDELQFDSRIAQESNRI